MSVEAGLLKDILENAADDAPRLVYADWLDDKGDPERAEFIRLQVRLAGLDAHDDARPDLERREWQLLRAHGKAWGKAGLRLTRRIEFTRGFVGRMTMAASKFVANAGRILASAPLTEVRLLQATGVIEAVASCRELLRLCALDVHSVALGAARTATLVGSPNVANLRELNLGYVHCRPSGLRAILRSPHLGNLRRLELNSNELTDDSLEGLVGCEALPDLRALDLGHQPIGGAGAEALNRAEWLGQLEELSLYDTPFGDAAVARLASSPRWANLRKLDLSNTGGTAAAVESLAASPHLANLRELRLRGVGDGGAVARIAQSPYLSGLRALDLRHAARPDNLWVQVLAKSSLAANLRELRLPPLPQSPGEQLLGAPAFSGLTTLDLGGFAGGGRELARYLAKANHLGRLVELGLSNCHLGSAGLADLAGCAHLSGLLRLDVASNQIGPDGFRALIASPYLKDLRQLRVWNNPGAQGDTGRRLLEHFPEGVCEGVTYAS